MTDIDALNAPMKGEPRRHRLTARARLALTYAALVTVAGGILLLIVSAFIGLVPSYSFGDTAALVTQTYPADDGDGVPTRSDLSSAETVPEAADSEVLVYPSLVLPQADAVTVGSRDDVLYLLFGVSGVALVVMAVAGAGAGWVIAGRMLRPLRYVNSAAHHAADGHLDHRISLQGPRDEISELADTFDTMLGRIEHSLDAHRRFAANASHELRTPLATTRAMLDDALGSSTSPAEKELLRRLRETNERSLDTVESLLDLAEIEAAVPHIEQVDLSRLVAVVVDECEAEATAVGVRVTRELPPASVDGDAVLLRQLITNLVHNAIRHNDQGGSASVSIRTDGDDILVVVSNSGPLISAHAAARLTDPFHRARGRTREAAVRGRGLGLSIAAAIVERHAGDLHLAPRESGGMDVTVRLPTIAGALSDDEV